MKTILTSVISDEGNLKHNQPVLVMTQEEAKHIDKVFRDSLAIAESTGERFDVLEQLLLSQSHRIDTLEKIIREMIGD